jgi:hypothetical protein
VSGLILPWTFSSFSSVAHISGTLSAVTYFLRLGLVTTGNSGTSTSDTEFCRFGLLGFSDFSTSVFFFSPFSWIHHPSEDHRNFTRHSRWASRFSIHPDLGSDFIVAFGIEIQFPIGSYTMGTERSWELLAAPLRGSNFRGSDGPVSKA